MPTQEVSNEYRVLTPGDVVSDHKVLRCNRLTERIEGETYASWVALCEAPEYEYHKWVTWVVVAHSSGFIAESGRYFVGGDYEKAYGDYERRGGW